MVTEKQRKAMTIFEMVLELLLGLFKAHHAKDLTPSTYPNEDMDNENIFSEQK